MGKISVNGEWIPESAIREEMAALRTSLERRGETLTFEQRLQLREEATETLIERTLLFQEARRLSLDPSVPEIEELAATLVPRTDGVSGCRAGVDPAAVAAEAQRRLTFDRLVALWGSKLKPAQPAEIRGYYRAHRDEFRRPESVHASHIVKHSEGSDAAENRVTLEGIRERLLAGEDFAALAVTYSDCPEQGGDLGFFARGVMVEEFDAVIFEAPLHMPTPIFETRFGLHCAVVHERRPAGVISAEEAGPRIAEALHRAKHDQEVGRRLAALRESARIQTV